VADPRIDEYARLLVEYSIDVQPGWQVAIVAGTNSRPLVDAVVRRIAARGAYALPRLTFSGRGFYDQAWLESAPDELLGTAAPIARHEAEQIDAHISIDSPENTSELGAVPAERIALYREAILPLVERTRSNEIPWVICQCADAGARAGRRHGHALVRGVPLRLRAARLGGRVAEDAAGQGAL